MIDKIIFDAEGIVIDTEAVGTGGRKFFYSAEALSMIGNGSNHCSPGAHLLKALR